MPEDPCPICNSRPIHRKRVLYGVPVCKKCFYGFANRRQIAYLIDAVAWQIAIIFPIGFIAGIMIATTPPGPAGQPNSAMQQLEFALNFLPYPLFLIFAMKDGFTGKSLGKSICGVMVLDQDTHEPITFLTSFKRNLILIVPILPLVVAFMLQRGYRIGDKWANTKVVWTKYRNHPLFTGQLACSGCQYDLRGCVSESCPECGHPIPERTRLAIQAAGPPQLNAPATPPTS